MLAQDAAAPTTEEPRCVLTNAGITAVSAADLLRATAIFHGDLEKVKKVLAGCRVSDLARSELRDRKQGALEQALKGTLGSGSEFLTNRATLELMTGTLSAARTSDRIDNTGDISVEWYSALKTYETDLAERVIEASTRITNPKDLLEYERFRNFELQRYVGCPGSGGVTCTSLELQPRFQVKFDQDHFWIGRTEVTEGAWKRVMEKDSKADSKFPKTGVTWKEAMSYCRAIGGTLPTEAQWEFAVHLGKEDYTAPANLEAIAWYGVNSGNSKVDAAKIFTESKAWEDGRKKLVAIGARTHEVASTKEALLGMYDMIGNVWEYTSTKFVSKAGQEVGVADLSETVDHVIKGGAYLSPSPTPFQRMSQSPNEKFGDVGFRCLWFPLKDLSK